MEENEKDKEKLVEQDLDITALPDDFVADTGKTDTATDAAVDDILRSDADAALPNSEGHPAVVMKQSIFERCKDACYSWWLSPRKRYGTFAVILALIAVICVVAPVRAAVLNTAGVRSSLIITVYDGSTRLPLKNVRVRVDDASVRTNEDGQAKLRGIHLGNQTVIVEKTAFATVQKQVQFGMRVVDMGDISLKAVGTQLTYQLSDYLSGKPIAGVALESGDASTKSDKTGKAILTIQPSDGDEAVKITVTKKGYRTETLSAPVAQRATVKQALIPAAKAVYVSKQSGKYDVYKMSVDGRDKEVLFAGTGLETQAITTLPSPDNSLVAVASTRDDKRNQDGYLLTALYIVDVKTGEAASIDYAEQIDLVGWHDNTLVFEQTVAGASAANPSRQTIVAYDAAASKRFQLANANYFTGYSLVGDTLYYGVSSTDPGAKDSLGRVNITGSGKKSLFQGDMWSMLRTGYKTFKFQTPDAWYEYTTSDASPKKINPPGDYTARSYIDSPAGSQSAWVDRRDASGVLIVHDSASDKDHELITKPYMQAVSYWLNDKTLVYRVSGAGEVADYVVSTDGGDAKKLADVTPATMYQ